jgi:hypothetical protein
MNIEKTIAAAIVSSLLLVSTPAFSDDAAESNRIFVTAVKALNEADTLSGNGLAVAENRFRLLDDVTENLNRIINDYSGADLAVKLMIGEEIGPVSMVRVQQTLDAARTQLAAALANCEEPALCLNNLALKETRSIEEPRLRASLLSGIAIEQISAELYTETLAAIDEAEGGLTRDNFLRAFAYAQFLDGDLEAAKNTANTIVDKPKRGYLYNNFVTELATTGQFAAALEIARRPLDDTYDERHRMFQDIAVAQAIAGRTADAFLTVGAIEDSWFRAIALEHMSIAQAEAGLLNEAIKTADAIEFSGPYVRAVSQLAISEADPSYFTVALDAARAIEDERARGWAHQRISEAQAELGQFAEAAETLSGVAWEGGRDGGFERIAVTQANAGQYSDAHETVERIISPSFSDNALEQIAVYQAEAGLFSDALETVQKIQEPSSNNDALAQVVGFLAQAGQFSEAFAISGQISEKRHHGQALGRIAIALAKAGKLTEAVQTVREVMDEDTQGRAFANIAIIQVEAGVLAAAIDAALEQTNERYRVLTLLEISRTLLKSP